MSITKIINQLLILLVFVSASNVYAEKPEHRVNEVAVSSIMLSNDRTGIVKNVYCSGCDFNTVKITENTRATRKGVAVDILEVKKLLGKVIMISFDPKTREVIYLRW